MERDLKEEIWEGSAAVWPTQGQGVVDAPARSAGASAALPCLYSNICNEEELVESINKLTGAHKKTAFKLQHNVRALVQKYGIERMVVCTVTHAQFCGDAKASQRKWHSFVTGYLNKHYKRRWLRVLERCESGCIHYHVLIAVPDDVRTGFDFEAYRRAREAYRSGGKCSEFRRQRVLWKRSRNAALVKGFEGFRAACQRYGFGKCIDFLPVLSNADAVAYYVGKYISKHIGHRLPADKGVRLIAYARGVGKASGAIAWNSPGAWLWRRKLGALAAKVGAKSLKQLGNVLGKNWAWKYSAVIMGIDLAARKGGVTYPTVKHMRADGRDMPEGFPEDAMDIHFGPLPEPGPCEDAAVPVVGPCFAPNALREDASGNPVWIPSAWKHLYREERNPDASRERRERMEAMETAGAAWHFKIKERLQGSVNWVTTADYSWLAREAKAHRLAREAREAEVITLGCNDDAAKGGAR